jgi:hypothetical protein
MLDKSLVYTGAQANDVEVIKNKLITLLQADLIYQPGDILIYEFYADVDSSTGNIEISVGTIEKPNTLGGAFGAVASTQMVNVKGIVGGQDANQQLINNELYQGNKIGGAGAYQLATNPQASDLVLDAYLGRVALGDEYQLLVPNTLVDENQNLRLSVDNGVTYYDVIDADQNNYIGTQAVDEAIKVVFGGNNAFVIHSTVKSIDRINTKLEAKLDVADSAYANLNDVENINPTSMPVFDGDRKGQALDLKSVKGVNNAIADTQVTQNIPKNATTELALTNKTIKNEADYSGTSVNGIETDTIHNANIDARIVYQGVNVDINKPLTVVFKLFKNGADTGLATENITVDSTDVKSYPFGFAKDYTTAVADDYTIRAVVSDQTGGRSIDILKDTRLILTNPAAGGETIIYSKNVENITGITEGTIGTNGKYVQHIADNGILKSYVAEFDTDISTTIDLSGFPKGEYKIEATNKTGEVASAFITVGGTYNRNFMKAFQSLSTSTGTASIPIINTSHLIASTTYEAVISVRKTSHIISLDAYDAVATDGTLNKLNYLIDSLNIINVPLNYIIRITKK